MENVTHATPILSVARAVSCMVPVSVLAETGVCMEMVGGVVSDVPVQEVVQLPDHVPVDGGSPHPVQEESVKLSVSRYPTELR